MYGFEDDFISLNVLFLVYFWILSLFLISSIVYSEFYIVSVELDVM